MQESAVSTGMAGLQVQQEAQPPAAKRARYEPRAQDEEAGEGSEDVWMERILDEIEAYGEQGNVAGQRGFLSAQKVLEYLG